jgi:hypothetical protein
MLVMFVFAGVMGPIGVVAALAGDETGASFCSLIEDTLCETFGELLWLDGFEGRLFLMLASALFMSSYETALILKISEISQ